MELVEVIIHGKSESANHKKDAEAGTDGAAEKERWRVLINTVHDEEFADRLFHLPWLLCHHSPMAQSESRRNPRRDCRIHLVVGQKCD